MYVYNDPTGNIYDAFRIPISTLYFLKDDFIEQLPVYGDTASAGYRYLYISNGQYVPLSDLGDMDGKRLRFHPLSEKSLGVRFMDMPVPEYRKRVSMPDTAFGGYNYRRVRIATDSAFTVFYIHRTDTVLPFSLASQFDTDYNGILNRIDTYEIMRGRFTSLRMSTGDTIPIHIYNTLKKQNTWKRK